MLSQIKVMGCTGPNYNSAASAHFSFTCRKSSDVFNCRRTLLGDTCVKFIFLGRNFWKI